MDKNKKLSSNGELVNDSLDAVAGGGGKGKGWTEQEKQRARKYCSNFVGSEAKFQKIITKYKTFDKFYKSIPESMRGFCDPD